MNLADLSELTTVIQNVVITVATIIGVFVGFRGLSAWRHEHLGKEKYESARRLLRALYKLKAALNSAFHFVKHGKLPHEDIVKGYELHDRLITGAMNEFLAEALEAEITIGKPFTRMSSVNGLRLLSCDITTLFWEQLGRDVSTYSAEIEAIYGGRFERDLTDVVADVEKTIQPYLGR